MSARHFHTLTCELDFFPGLSLTRVGRWTSNEMSLETLADSFRRSSKALLCPTVPIRSTHARTHKQMRFEARGRGQLKSAQILVGHPALHEGHAGGAFAMPLPPPDAERARRGGRAIFKAKRKGVADAETNAAAAAASSSAASAAGAGSGAAVAPASASASLLPAPVGSDLSFFSSAHIALCDFNIAVPVVEPSDDADIDADGGAHSAPLLEYVGTLRWCAPEVFRASGTNAATGTAAAVPTAVRSSAAAAAGAGAAATASASASSSGARPSLAALRLHAGRMGDVWSWSMVLLELLTLRLPFEDVATEEQLNQMLSRGERSDFQSWLDEGIWSGVGKMDPAVMEKRARAAWERVVAASASSAAGASTPASPVVAAAASPSSLRQSVYEALVGLYLVGTSSVPEDRPSIQQIRAGLETLHQQLTVAKARSAQPLALESAAAAVPSASAAAAHPPRQEGAPSPRLTAVSHKHAAPASNSPPLRSTRARLNAAAGKLSPQQPISPSLAPVAL